MLNWRIVELGPLPPQQIMEQDEKWLMQLSAYDQPLLHLYEWDSPCITHGRFICPSSYLHIDTVTAQNIQIVKRPTGGGVTFHLTDLAFSILLPASGLGDALRARDNYSLLNRYVAKAIENYAKGQINLCIQTKDATPTHASCLSFCMARPSAGDLMVEGRKIVGAALRRTRQGLLYQGTISLGLLSADWLATVLKDAAVVAAIQNYTYPLFAESDLALARQQLRVCLREAFTEPF